MYLTSILSAVKRANGMFHGYPKTYSRVFNILQSLSYLFKMSDRLIAEQHSEKNVSVKLANIRKDERVEIFIDQVNSNETLINERRICVVVVVCSTVSGVHQLRVANDDGNQIWHFVVVGEHIFRAVVRRLLITPPESFCLIVV
uniref:Kinesin motor domain-containing protein n=1 Tax=Ascaris lumbricoides TaxID=6252 RepID=A0A0M3IK22_ASCLU